MSAQLQRLPQPAIRLQPRLPRKQSERGASMVEFAIIITLLFLLIFGIIQFGFAFNRDQGLHAAAREGARVAAVGGTQDDVADRVREAQSLFNENDLRIRIDYSTDNGASYPGGNMICDDAGGTHCTNQLNPVCAGKIGNLIRVTATVPAGVGSGRYAIIIPFWGNVNITFSSQGVFRCEQQ
ncbi:MAG: TadE family protein [Actinomycetota bacterium]